MNQERLFNRSITANPSTHSRRIAINYQPNGFWTDRAITVSLEFVSEHMPHKPNSPQVDGHFYEVSIQHSGGGQQDDANPLEAARSFTAAYSDAIALVELANARIAGGTSFKDLMFEFLVLDMPMDSLKRFKPGIAPPQGITLVTLADGVIAAYGELWLNAEMAKAELLKKFNADTQFHERDATPTENRYWSMLRYHYHEIIVGKEANDASSQ